MAHPVGLTPKHRFGGGGAKARTRDFEISRRVRVHGSTFRIGESRGQQLWRAPEDLVRTPEQASDPDSSTPANPYPMLTEAEQEELFDTLCTWNDELERLGIDFEEPSP